MGSSAQNSSGVHWCRARSGSTGLREGSREGLGGFGADPGQVQQGSGEGSGEGLGSLGAEPGQVQEGSGEGFGKGLGGFGAEPGQVQTLVNRFLEKVPEKVWEALVQVWEALVQSQVRFNKVSEMFVFLR